MALKKARSTRATWGRVRGRGLEARVGRGVGVGDGLGLGLGLASRGATVRVAKRKWSCGNSARYSKALTKRRKAFTALRFCTC